MERLPKFCSLEQIIIGRVFAIPGNPLSNVTCEYTLKITVPAQKFGVFEASTNPAVKAATAAGPHRECAD